MVVIYLYCVIMCMREMENTLNKPQGFYNMKKYTLYLGLNDKDTKKQEVNYFDAYKLVNSIVFSRVNGATFSKREGYYKHEDGTLVIENTICIELLFTDFETVKEIVALLKETFNQESIAVQTQTIESELM